MFTVVSSHIWRTVPLFVREETRFFFSWLRKNESHLNPRQANTEPEVVKMLALLRQQENENASQHKQVDNSSLKKKRSRKKKEVITNPHSYKDEETVTS